MNPPQIQCAPGVASRSPARTVNPFPCWSPLKLPSASTSQIFLLTEHGWNAWLNYGFSLPCSPMRSDLSIEAHQIARSHGPSCRALRRIPSSALPIEHPSLVLPRPDHTSTTFYKGSSV